MSRPHVFVIAAMALALCLAPGCKKKQETVEPEDDTWIPDESNEPRIAAAATMSEEERTSKAKDLYTLAEDKAAAEDWAAALPLYEEAYYLMPEKHGFALKVGDTAMNLGDCAKALQYYEHFVKYAEGDKYASDIRRVKKKISAGCN